VPANWVPTTYGGTTIDDIRSLGEARLTIAIGEQMRAPAQRIEALTGVEYALFRQLHGLKAVDRLVALLMELSERPAPAWVRRRRRSCRTCCSTATSIFSGKKIAIAAEPDLLCGLATFFVGMGAEIHAAVTTTGHSKSLEHVPCDSVKVGTSATSRRWPKAPTCWSPTATGGRRRNGSAYR